ncbi:MAG: hypothetical protein Q7R47_01900, partial [Candidatus Diapherotrites archaeon]|nr:hypothetical protein [Candidatus Diapherotrites archaeon]
MSLAKQLACYLLVFSLLGTQFSMVFAQTPFPPAPDLAEPTGQPPAVTDPNAEFPLSDTTPQTPLTGILPLNDSAANPVDETRNPNETNRTSFSCANTVLDPRERQALWDNTLYNGFVGKELSSGAPANKKRDTTDRDTLILPNKQDKLAIKQKIPNQKIDPSEIAHLLNKHFSGAFAFGLEIDDSLRIGKCDDVNSSCALMGKALSFRNSGAGIVANVKNVYQDLFKAFRPDDQNFKPIGFSGPEAAYVRAQIIQAGADNNVIEAQVANRVVGKTIPNSVMASTFSASMNANCTGATCTINSYSMFDKLFNAYVSTDMLVGAFGPTLFNQTKKMFSWTGSRQPFFKIGETALATRIKSLYARPTGWYGKFILDRQYKRIQQEAIGFDNTIAG